MDAYIQSHKPSKYNEQDTLDTAGETDTLSYALLHTDTPVLADLQLLKYVSSVLTLGAV